MKRLLVVSHSKDNRDSGSSRVVHLMGEALAGQAITVVLRHNEMNFDNALQRLLGRTILPRLVSGLVPDAETYDAIIGFNGMLHPLFRRLRRLKARPALIDYVHGLSTFDRIATLSEFEAGLTRFSWHYRYITAPLTQRLPSTWELHGARLADVAVVQNSRDREFLVRNGIPTVSQISLPLLPEIAKAATGASQSGRDPKKVLWFGAWGDRKGAHYLPGAWDIVLRRMPAATLTVGGTGRPAGYVLSQFSEGSRGSVRVLGHISVAQQIDEYATHSIFLFPSLSEGFGFALLEAMSMALAPVATLTGLAADHAVAGREFLAVPMASSERLADAILQLMENEALRHGIAAAAQQLASRFTLERYGQQLLTIIASAQAKRASESAG